MLDTGSSEALLDLRFFAAELEKWNASINLVSKATLAELWDRHILDCVQVFHVKQDLGHHADLGTGAGLPGMVMSIMCKHHKPEIQSILVEADQRKASFLRTMKAKLKTNTVIKAERIENLAPLEADTLTARALADLDTLLSFADRHLSSNGTCLFLKGENWLQELAQAKENWNFDYEALTSKTNTKSVILEIGNISRVSS